MASYAQREQLEQIMGRDALLRLPMDYKKEQSGNGGTSIEEASRILSNPRICKSFLIAKCPYDLFLSTKEDQGKCPKIHSMKYKILYDSIVKKQESNAIGGVASGESILPNNNFEIDYMNDLSRFLGECDKKIMIQSKRLEYDKDNVEDEDTTKKINSLTIELDELDTRISLMTQEIHFLNDQEDKLLKSLELSKDLEFLLLQRESLSNRYTNVLENLNQSSQQKLQICSQCGAYLSRLDNDRRLADHFMGKLHLNYVELRSNLKELKDKFN